MCYQAPRTHLPRQGKTRPFSRVCVVLTLLHKAELCLLAGDGMMLAVCFLVGRIMEARCHCVRRVVRVFLHSMHNLAYIQP